MLRRHVAQVVQLEQHAMMALLPVFKQAEHELRIQLQRWVTTAPDGELRWTAQHYRVALAQLRGGIETLEQQLSRSLTHAATQAEILAMQHLVDEVARFSAIFEGVPRHLAVDAAKVVATSRSYIIPRMRTSAARYAGDVARDIKQRLAVDILKGAPLSETVDRLVEHGGPTGVVALRGVAGEEGALLEFIPEGLFRRYRWWAERIVRTETASAYSVVGVDAMRAARGQVPGLMKRMCADGGGCSRVCQPTDGQVVGLDEDFQTPIGPRDGTPLHPCCRCRSGAWKSDWPELLDSVGLN